MQPAPLQRIASYYVVVEFLESEVFKYGPPRSLLSDNSS